MVFSKEFLKQIGTKIIGFLFPEFSDKLTWAVVISGLTLMSSRLWERIVLDLLRKEFNLNITDGNDAIVGVILVISGLLHNFLCYKEKNKKPLDDKSNLIVHDQETFLKLDTILNESKLRDFVDFVVRNHSYMSNEIEPLHKFIGECKNTENIFLDENVESKRIQLNNGLNKFLSFLATSFFVYDSKRDDNLLYFCMYPDSNIDRASRYPSAEQIEAYDVATEQLTSLCEQILQLYKDFRIAVKSNLLI